MALRLLPGHHSHKSVPQFRVYRMLHQTVANLGPILCHHCNVALEEVRQSLSAVIVVDFCIKM